MNQTTLLKKLEFKGTGLHTGEEMTLRLIPAEPDTGIVFVRTDLAESPMIPVSPEYVIATERETTIGQGEVVLHTVEHLLSACGGLGLDNLRIEVDGPEIPIMDGSALPFVLAIQKVGLKIYNVPRRIFRVREPIWLEDGDKQIIILPCTNFKISATIAFSSHGIGAQFLSLEINPEAYAAEIAGARTFCPLEDVEQLRARGLIKGGSLENAVVFDANGPVKGCTLRYPDEAVRHKILDVIGDLMFLGSRIQGHVIMIRGGHALNVRMCRKLDELRQKTVAYYHNSLSVANEQLDIQAIKKILPHRYPFLLVDRILSIEAGKKVVGLKNVTGNEDFFNGHFPNYPIMPGVLLIEAMAQCGGVMLLASINKPGRLVFFSAIDKVRFRKPVVPGDQVIFEVEAVKMRSRSGLIHGKAFVEGQLVAEADMMFALPEE